ncbi:MAG: type II toxin-antitoxin system RelE/ParE family toxin [Sulfurimonas sp.]|nr:type II toxin-antitoxin system RelE/ParE family toxin [Sulfurimonas sp.]MDD3835549.1 type II toxin-antitoxin system RelE/ParE family toxin [Sulfurimonas sp.]
MNKWNISFYSARVEKETLSFPDGILADFIRIGEMIEKHGPNLGKPHTDSLGNKLFEIRAKAKEGIGRSIFCYAIDKTNEIVILHSFVKKTQKTPKKDIEIALKRKKDFENEN